MTELPMPPDGYRLTAASYVSEDGRVTVHYAWDYAANDFAGGWVVSITTHSEPFLWQHPRSAALREQQRQFLEDTP